MLTKEDINKLKVNGNGQLAKLVSQYRDKNNYILFILENLGYLPVDFDGSWLLELLNSNSNQIRFWAVKNLGKLKNENYLDNLKTVALNDEDTTVRREAASSIGRMRISKGKGVLFELLKQEDPKIVCQAIRGLLVFKGQNEVDTKLKDLLSHKNEMVSSIIKKEYFSEQKLNSTCKGHTDTIPLLINTVINGDVREILRNIQEECIHLTFTSPPYYNARDYSIYPSYQAYLEFLEEVFKEVYRLTKEGRFLIVNTSPIIIPRISRSHSSKRYPIPFDLHSYLVKMGWEFIDDIIWLKPEASVKNRNAGFLQHRKPLGYKPNAITEYLMVYRKGTEKLLDWNIKQYNYDIINESKVDDGYETTNVWKIDPKFDKVHSAVFPIELCKRVIQYYSVKNDLVFDPFGGSGTLGRTAKSLGRNFFLTEIDKNYFEYMKTFLKKESMFDDVPAKFLSYQEFAKLIKPNDSY